MWTIRRVYLDGIGTRAARFRNLTLDLTAEGSGAPLHSLAWLRNGGGKSSLIALIGALLRPEKTEFLSATSKRRDASGRCLGDYVLDGDTSHVLIEWGDQEGRRLVTGAVFEWPDRVAPADPYRDHERLRQLRYVFVPKAGTAEIDRLPFVVNGIRTSAEHFVANIKPWAALTKVEFPKTQADWAARLDAFGIDSDLWRTIVEMNRTEGGIDDQFLFSTPNDFVKYLLRLIVDPQDTDPVAGLLRDVSDQLASRPDTLAELRFADGAIERLTELEHACADDLAARELMREAEEEARRLRTALAAASDIAAEQGKVAEGERLVADREEKEAQLASAIARTSALEYRRLAALLRRETAERRLDEITGDVAASEEQAETWLATSSVARHDAIAKQVTVLRDHLRRATEEAEPLADHLANAAAELAGRLDELAVAGQRQAEAEEEHARELAQTAKRQTEEQIAGERQASSLEAQTRASERRIGEFDAELDALLRVGALEPGEEPKAASARLEAEDAYAGERIDQLTSDIGACDSALESGQELLANLARNAQEARRAREALVGERDGLLARANELAADPRIETLSENEVDPIGTAEALISRFDSEIRRAQREIIALGVEGAEDERAVDSIQDLGLLPPALDLARALDVLASRRIPAVAGWTYLADVVAPERRLAAFRTAPLLASAVLVHDPARVADARDAIASVLQPTIALVVASTADLDAAIAGLASDHILVPPNDALFDRDSAKNELAKRAETQTSRSNRETALNSERESDQALRGRIQALAQDCPPGYLESLGARIESAAGASVAAGQAEETAKTKLGEQKIKLGRLHQERHTSADKRRALAGFIARIRPLAERSTEIDGLRSQVLQAPVELVTLRTAAAKHEAAAQESVQASRVAHDQSVSLGNQVRELRVERGKLPPGLITSRAAEGEGIDALRSAYATADRLWRDATSESEIARELGTTETNLADAARPLDGFPSSRITRAREFLATAEGSTQQGREAATKSARAAHAARVKEQGAWEQELRGANDEIDDITSHLTDGRRFRAVEEPADREDALARASALEADQQRHSAEATAASKRVEAARLRVEELKSRANVFSTRASMIELSIDQESRDTLPFSGSPEEAQGRVDHVRLVMRQARAEFERTAEGLRKCASEALFWSSSADFAHVTADVRARFQNPSYAAETGAEAGQLRRQFQINRDTIAAHLRELDEHRENVIKRAIGLARIALRDLERFSRLSEVPDGLAGWTGHRFVDVGPKAPPDLADPVLRDRIGKAIDVILDHRSAIDGLDLLWRSLEAVVGEAGFRAKVLKPLASLEIERVSIEQMGKWSGGEKVTAAILLFTTLARLRAANRGRSIAQGAGTLILDNPVGKANYVGFLQLQLKIAEAAGVQLFFFTGISDLRSIDRFPNILRMRNLASGDRGYILLENQQRDEDSVSVARGQRLVEAPELFPA